ncbi:MAG: prephenate dehydrogenase/arogenate dehydrogenase family protein [Armatimonadota bacterium]
MDGALYVNIGTLGIAGVGLIGGSIGLAVKHRGLASKVIGIGRNRERLDMAIGTGAIDEYSLDFLDAAERCDTLYLAAPVLTIIEQLRVLQNVKSNLLVSDGGSTKGEIVRAADGLPANVKFVGGHPMAGSEENGVEAASANLYSGATYALTPTNQTDPDALKTVCAFAEAIGSDVVIIGADEHDRAVAATSHLPHIIAGAFLQTAETASIQVHRMAAGSFRDITRVSESPPALWRDICITNKAAILSALIDFKESLSAVEQFLHSEDLDSLEKWFAKGKEIHRTFHQGKGRTS